MCGFHHKNQSGLELKIVLPIENGEEPNDRGKIHETWGGS
jgi:hypothetical protein